MVGDWPSICFIYVLIVAQVIPWLTNNNLHDSSYNSLCWLRLHVACADKCKWFVSQILLWTTIDNNIYNIQAASWGKWRHFGIHFQTTKPPWGQNQKSDNIKITRHTYKCRKADDCLLEVFHGGSSKWCAASLARCFEKLALLCIDYKWISTHIAKILVVIVKQCPCN